MNVKLSGDHKLLPSMFLAILTLLIRSSEQKKNVFLVSSHHPLHCWCSPENIFVQLAEIGADS